MQKLIEEMSNQEIEAIVESMENYEEVEDALEELIRRREEKSIAISKKIVEDKLGDIYLQARVFELIYNEDLRCAIELLDKNMDDLDSYVIACALDCLSEDSNIIDLMMVSGVVKKLLIKIDDIQTADTSIGNNIKESIEWFKNSYGTKV